MTFSNLTMEADNLSNPAFYSGVSNIGYIWSLEERSYEAWAVLEID